MKCEYCPFCILLYNLINKMLPKKHRIDKKLFKEVLSKGKTYNSNHLFLKTLSLASKNPLFTFVVSKKTSKKAVARNKLKRRGRYIAKKNLDSFKKETANIIFFKPGSETLKFPELEEKILELFERAKIL